MRMFSSVVEVNRKFTGFSKLTAKMKFLELLALVRAAQILCFWRCMVFRSGNIQYVNCSAVGKLHVASFYTTVKIRGWKTYVISLKYHMGQDHRDLALS